MVSENMNQALVKKFYHSLYRIRRVEEEIVRLYPTDRIKSPVHLSIGQEAISVGVCEALAETDIVFGTYRGHAMYLAKGGDLKKMLCELYGKKNGCSQGKGGSMHLADVSNGVQGTSAIVGTTIPISVGYALGLKIKHPGSVVVSFFGDGAVDEGAFHESLNFAALKKLPVFFVCENNSYAIHSHYLSRRASDNACSRARTYGIPSLRIRDGEIFKIYKASKNIIGKIRRGEGPFFLECDTCRWKEHVGPCDDFHLGYRSEREVARWKKNDQVKKLAALLGSQNRQRIEDQIEKEIGEAFDSASNSEFPGPEDLKKDLFQ
jgi:TPP-dependent pyruvate/acetoin dehydrogenase alpha subunit